MCCSLSEVAGHLLCLAGLTGLIPVGGSEIHLPFAFQAPKLNLQTHSYIRSCLAKCCRNSTRHLKLGHTLLWLWARPRWSHHVWAALAVSGHRQTKLFFLILLPFRFWAWLTMTSNATSLHMCSPGHCDRSLVSTPFKFSYKRTHEQVTAPPVFGIMKRSLQW